MRYTDFRERGVQDVSNAKISAYSIRTQFGMSSGPHAGKVLTWGTFLATDYLVTTIGSSSAADTGALSAKGE